MEQTKYLKTYNALMVKASNRKLVVGYTEKHHIIPKSFNGSNSKSNLVRLTAREHYIAHLLLYGHYKRYGTDKQMTMTAYALLYFLSTSKVNRTPNRLKVTAGKARVYNDVRSTLSKAKLGKPLTDLISAEGYTKYLQAHKNRRKYLDVFKWIHADGTLETCSVYELGDKYSLPYGGLIKVAYKHSKTSKGWRIVGSSTNRVLKCYNRECVLRNIVTTEKVMGTLVKVSDKTGIPISRMARVLKGSRSGDWCNAMTYERQRHAYLQSNMLHTFLHTSGIEKCASAKVMAKFVKDFNIHVLVNTMNYTRSVRGWKLKEMK